MTKVRVNLSLGSVSDRGAERCFKGGIAAGVIAARLDDARREVTFSDQPSRFTVRRSFEDAEKLVRDLRKNVPGGRLEMIELDKKLKYWIKDLSDPLMLSFPEWQKTRVETDLKEMRSLVRKSVKFALKQCGKKFGASESDAAEAIHDHAYHLDRPAIPQAPKQEPLAGRKLVRSKRRKS